MTTTVTRPTAPAPPASPPTIVPVPSLAAAVLDASEAVVRLGSDDPRWDELGPLLTAFVDAARRAVGLAGSPIGPGEDVAPVLRLRDLARLAARTTSSVGASTAAPPPVASGLRSLQNAARRCEVG